MSVCAQMSENEKNKVIDDKAAVKRVVIIGAGFGGLSAARKMANKPGIEVTLIDKHNYHLFQPLLYQVATSTIASAEIAYSTRSILKNAKNVRVFMDRVNDVDKDKQLVHTKNGLEVEYDELIVATGAKHSYFGRDEWADIAPGLKTIDDALYLRQRILSAFEKAEVLSDPDVRQSYLNFVIIGAGPTGVELAGAIAELAHRSLVGEFREYSTQDARIILVDAAPDVLCTFDPKLAGSARRQLESLGVEIVTNTMVENMGPDFIELGDKRIETRSIIWAAGVQASRASIWLDVEPDHAGRVVVNGQCQVPDYPNIYVIGDTSSFTPEGAERPLPGVAPVAKQQGEFVAKRIVQSTKGNDCNKVFHYHDRGAMATIGQNRAIGDLYNKFKVTGFLGWFLWCVLHIYYLVGFRNRFVVGINWLQSYFTSKRGIRLIISRDQDKDDEW